MAQRRRRRLNGERMHRLQIAISETAHRKLRDFAPEWGDGAVIEHMIEREAEKRQRRALEKQEGYIEKLNTTSV